VNLQKGALEVSGLRTFAGKSGDRVLNRMAISSVTDPANQNPLRPLRPSVQKRPFAIFVDLRNLLEFTRG
jgi:hypothetical protein